MAKQIFINLHVSNLDKAKSFYSKLGFSMNEQFSDATAACFVVSDTVSVMLLTHAKFKEFTPKQISDATKTSEVLNAMSVESRDQVDEIVGAALASGGTEMRPAQDRGFMYGRAINDPDGHIWEIFWFDANPAPTA